MAQVSSAKRNEAYPERRRDASSVDWFAEGERVVLIYRRLRNQAPTSRPLLRERDERREQYTGD